MSFKSIVETNLLMMKTIKCADLIQNVIMIHALSRMIIITIVIRNCFRIYLVPNKLLRWQHRIVLRDLKISRNRFLYKKEHSKIFDHETIKKKNKNSISWWYKIFHAYTECSIHLESYYVWIINILFQTYKIP